MYQTKNDLWDERHNFEMSLSYIDPTIPRAAFKIESVYELPEHFIMWEYAIAMCGYLMKVCPFDQPDVASAKAAVLDILRDGQPEPDYVQDFVDDVHMGQVEVRQAPCFKDCTDVRASLRALLASIQPGDFFALNATAWPRSAAWCHAWKSARATCIPRASCKRAARTAACSLSCRQTS